MEDNLEHKDVFTQNGVFLDLSSNDENVGGLLGGTVYITEIEEKDKCFVRWVPYPENEAGENIKTLEVDSKSVINSQSNETGQKSPTSEYHTIDPDWTLVNDGDQMVAFLKVGKGAQSMQRRSSDNDKSITVDVSEIDSLRKSKKGLGWPSITIIRRDGSSLPTFHFHEKGCKRFVRHLKMYVYIMPSSTDQNLLQLTHHDETALTRSFDELQLFGSPSPSDSENNIASKALKNPGIFALRSFSRVTNFFQDMFVQNEHESRPAAEVAGVVDSTEALGSGRIQIKHGKEQSNGFEVITYAQLGPRKEEPRGEVVTEEVLNSYKDAEGRILRVDELNLAVFKGGIEPSLRKELWKYLLDYYCWDMTKAELVERRKAREDDYYRMKMQWKSINEGQQKRFSTLRERKCLIEKDVVRTDRTRMFYKEDDNLSLKLLYDILMTYCMYNFDLGYVQGMSDLLSPLLEVMENEVDAFWCFVGYMNLVHHNFEANQHGMKQQLGDLRVLLQFMEPQLWDHLQDKESSNLYFCFRWLLIHFKREFSYENIQSLWEVLWTKLPCYNFHLLVCLAILETEKSNLMDENCGFTEILKHINDLAGNIDVDGTLRKAYGIYCQLAACQKDLPDTVKHILGLNEGGN